MTLDIGNTDKLNGYRRDLEKIGVELLPPDVKRSTAEFTVERTAEGKKAIRYALAAIKGVGREAMARLVAEREENGPFKDLFDFAERLDQRVLNKRLVESLVKAGGFDTLNKNRAQTFGAIEALMRHSRRRANRAAATRTACSATTPRSAGRNCPRCPTGRRWNGCSRNFPPSASISRRIRWRRTTRACSGWA